MGGGTSGGGGCVTGYFEEKIAAVKGLLERCAQLEVCRILTAYPSGRRPYPLTKPRVAISLRGAEAEPVTVGGGEKRIRTEIGMDLYLPLTTEGSVTWTLYSAVLEQLLFESDLPVVKAEAGEVKPDGNAGALVMQNRIWLEEVL